VGQIFSFMKTLGFIECKGEGESENE